MREIKFKVTAFILDKYITYNVDLNDLHLYTDEKDVHIRQYTGLKDKNGTEELYEGDIFHLGDKNILHVIEWHDTGFMGRQVHTKGSYVGLKHWNDRIEKVGNIYENKDLLD